MLCSYDLRVKLGEEGMVRNKAVHVVLGIRAMTAPRIKMRCPESGIPQ